MIRCLIGLFFSIILISVSSIAQASIQGTVYYTSLDNQTVTFAKYDVATNTWTNLTPHATNTQMAVDINNDLYSYNHLTNKIELYNSGLDTWSNVMNGPGINPNYGNLEVTNSGRFLLTGLGTSSVFYSDGGGIWNSAPLGFTANAMGDYDPTTGEYVIGRSGVKRVYEVDTTTFATTESSLGVSGAGEIRRSGSILDGRVYEHTTNFDLNVWDLNNLSLIPTTIGQPSNLVWAATAADRENSSLYLADLFRGNFFRLDGNTFTALASAPSVSNHSSIAFVPSNQPIPEPSSIAIWSLIGGIGLIAGWRRRRKTAA